MKRIKYEILSGFTGTTIYQLPIFLEASVDEMGIMVGFDGDMEQIEQFCNFTYSGSGKTIIVYNTLNTTKLRTLVDSTFTISWGDGDPDTSLPMTTVYDANLSKATHTYVNNGFYNLKITVNSPWQIDKLSREIYIPFSGITYPNPLGTLTGITIPYSDFNSIGEHIPPMTGRTQDYLQDYTSTTINPDPLTGVTISFLAVGKSRLDEKKIYGSGNTYNNVQYLSKLIDGVPVSYTGYTISGNTGIDNLYYMDYPENYTYITGNTINFAIEELYQGMITRNEYLIGFLDEPQIYSDIFIERGKQGVMERNLRLGEIDSVGELDIYGSGFFKVKKQ